MSEMALATARRARLEAMRASGDAGAVRALELMDRPTQFLSTVQVGITTISVLTGIVGDSAFSPHVSGWLQGWGVPAGAAPFLATALVVTSITFTSLIFGELVPKRIGQIYPERMARWVSRPMHALAWIARPFVALLTLTTQAVLRLLHVQADAARQVTEEEIAASLEEGVDAGLIEENEHAMVQNVFLLDNRALASIMVPRSDIVWLHASATVAESLLLLSQTPDTTAHGEDTRHIHSWYPVCKGSLNQVVGLVSVGQLLKFQSYPQYLLGDIALPATFVPETLSGMELLEQFRHQAGRMVFVVDEYGELQGILTPHDLLEAITGELQPESHDDAWAVQTGAHQWRLDGMIPPSELRNRLQINTLPDEDDDHYHTLAGLIMRVSGEMPTIGQKVTIGGWLFEVTALDGKRIEQVLARRIHADTERQKKQ